MNIGQSKEANLEKRFQVSGNTYFEHILFFKVILKLF